MVTYPLYLWYPTLRLLRVISGSWMMRSGLSSLISPMDELVPLHSFLPLNPHPIPLHPPLLLIGSQPPLPPPLLPLAGFWVT